MVTAYYTEINDLPEWRIVKPHLDRLNEGAREKILAYRSVHEQLTRLCGKLLLSKFLSHNGSASSVNDVTYSESGKPYLSDNACFNIAHSGNIVICACSINSKIGVDIEKHTEVDITLMQEYFTTKEWHKIQSAEDWPDALYNMWVRKEAYIKAIGKGVYQPLYKVDVSEQSVIADGTTWHFYNIFIKKGYSACIATDRNDTIELIEIDLKTLLNGTNNDT